MKYISIVFIFSILISIYSQGIYAYNGVNSNIYVKNTDLNIKGSKLIKKYLFNLLNKLNELKIKYNLAKNNEIQNYSKTLSSMIRLLSKIETKNISKSKAEEVMRVIIKELKPLNIKIKNLIKKEKRKQNKKTNNIKKQYYNLNSRLSLALDKIIIKLYIPIRNKSDLTNKDKNLLKILRDLKRNSDSVKNIKNLNLKGIEKIKQKLLSILKEIKKNLSILKKI